MLNFSYKCSTECNVQIVESNAKINPFKGCLKNVNRVALFYSKNVSNHFIKAIEGAISEFNIQVYLFKFSDGETQKTLTQTVTLANFLHENEFSRNDLIINVGGGTLCDMGAFVASLYKRGINYINVPTTLLCAVDACIGGKTAVDANGVKNLLGTFKQPKAVVIYTDILKDLPINLFNEGLSEIVKYGVINPQFCEYLKTNSDLNALIQNLPEILYRSLKIKAELVEADEYDFNVRHALNAGHTTAHALESVSEFKINHANAVAIGLIVESKLALKLNLISLTRYNSLQNLFKLLTKPECFKVSTQEIIGFMKSDKKNFSNKITFVLPNETGVSSVELTKEQVENLIDLTW